MKQRERMPMMTLESLGRLIVKKRGGQGIRATAKIIGISPATLSRVEHGHLPDLENFKKICRWLEIDMSSVVGASTQRKGGEMPRVHFKKDKAIKQETAVALAEMILAVERAMAHQEVR
jgi:transcriptional regulator with XRE-family HTH domain